MANRNFSSAIGYGKAAPSFPHIWDPTINIVTETGLQVGAWRPYATNDVSVSNANITGVVSVQPSTSISASNSIPSGVAPFSGMNGITGTALKANLNRIMFGLQNIHTDLPLYVLFGSTTAGTGNFNLILNPSNSMGYGGDTLTDDHYRGQINVSGGAWNAFEL